MKAQIWSFDFIISLLIFLIVMISLLFSFGYANREATEHIALNGMERKALFVSDLLVRSPGIPEDWNISTIKTLGLAEKDNVLNKTKVEYALNLTNNEIKHFLGIELYNFSLKVTDMNNQTVKIDGIPVIKGEEPNKASFVVPVKRLVIFNHTICNFLFVLWV